MKVLGGLFKKDIYIVEQYATMMCPGQPSNTNGKQDCVVIRASSGNWDDVVCSKDYKFVCKTSTVGGEGR